MYFASSSLPVPVSPQQQDRSIGGGHPVRQFEHLHQRAGSPNDPQFGPDRLAQQQIVALEVLVRTGVTGGGGRKVGEDRQQLQVGAGEVAAADPVQNLDDTDGLGLADHRRRQQTSGLEGAQSIDAVVEIGAGGDIHDVDGTTPFDHPAGRSRGWASNSRPSSASPRSPTAAAKSSPLRSEFSVSTLLASAPATVAALLAIWSKTTGSSSELLMAADASARAERDC